MARSASGKAAQAGISSGRSSLLARVRVRYRLDRHAASSGRVRTEDSMALMGQVSIAQASLTQRFSKGLSLVLVMLSLSGCGIQSIPQSKNQVDAALAEITNQYKRRSDLIPNLVETVKGYATQERETLEAVVSARAKATQVTIDPSRATPEQIAQFQGAQGQLSQALGRLLMVSENYPDLKSNQNFRDLQAQLEGTENRITVARQRYIEAIQGFNNLLTVPPTSWTNSLLYHHPVMPQWGGEVTEQEKQAPKVKF
ncbi:MAG: LemA family protein [Bdellovibrionaceae bacterium]|nr:LemA family protein [Pseudobdellovibrionaceae bacterium]